MHSMRLRRVGGSVMLTLPPAVLEQLQLRAGATVGASVEDGRLVIEPRRRPRYTLAEILAASEYGEAPDADEQEWVQAAPVGRELL